MTISSPLTIVTAAAPSTPSQTPATQVQQVVQGVSWTSAGWGVVILLVGVALSYLVRLGVKAGMEMLAHRTAASARAFGQIAQWAVIILTLGAAVTYVFPSVKPVNLIGGLGVVSIAAGIAFQTVLGNMFAGLVILMRQTPLVGDQIQIGKVAGTITDINLSTTTVRTFSGRQVLIPNGTVHTSVVTVQNRHENIRTAFEIQIRNEKDYVRAREVAVQALLDSPAVSNEPAPVAVLREVTDGMATMEVRFWSGSRQLDTVHALDAAIIAVTDAFAAQDIEFGPDNTVVVHRT